MIFTPRPAAERQQLRRFCGRARAPRRGARRLRPDPSRRPAPRPRARAARAPTPKPPPGARRRAALPRAGPALFHPGRRPAPLALVAAARVGDASVTFDRRGAGQLTFAVNASEAEGVSLFDRAKRRQICLYPSGGREPPLQRGRRPGRRPAASRPPRPLRARSDACLAGEATLHAAAAAARHHGAPASGRRLHGRVRHLGARAAATCSSACADQDGLMISLGPWPGRRRDRRSPCATRATTSRRRWSRRSCRSVQPRRPPTEKPG